MRLKTVVALVSVLGATVALSLVTSSWATHSRPASGTPVRIPLVNAYKPCITPNTTHVSPLALPSCTPPPGLESNIITSGSTGAASAFTKLKLICTDATTPPCGGPLNGQQEDITVEAHGRDVRCRIGGVPGCSAAGADFTGTLIGTSRIRITDHSGNSTACANASGAPPCTVVTAQDADFAVTSPCVDNGGPNGGRCDVTTTINAQVPGAVKEQQAGIVSTFQYKVLDWGPDGSVGTLCPPFCGTGDEGTAAVQGLFLP